TRRAPSGWAILRTQTSTVGCARLLVLAREGLHVRLPAPRVTRVDLRRWRCRWSWRPLGFRVRTTWSIEPTVRSGKEGGMTQHAGQSADELARRCAAAMWESDLASRELGMVLEEVHAGFARLSMRVAEHMVNGHAVCHGGYIATLADSA